MYLRSALAIALLTMGLASCGDVRTSPNGPGNSQDTFAPAANLDGQSQPRGDRSDARAIETREADPNPPGNANRDGNPGYGYTLKEPPKPD